MDFPFYAWFFKFRTAWFLFYRKQATIIITAFNRNTNIGLMCRSVLCPDKTYEVTLLNDKAFELNLPEGSVYSYKNMAYMYYNRKNITECKDYFDKELASMKTENKIIDYSFNDSKRLYEINVDNKYSFKILLLKDTKIFKYTIVDKATLFMLRGK